MKIKSQLLLLIFGVFLTLGTVNNGQAQDHSQNWEAGLRLGPIGSSVVGMDNGYDSNNDKISGVVGAFFRYGKDLYAETGFEYIGDNMSFEDSESQEDELGFTTFNIPLVVGYKVINEDQWNLRAFGGGNLAFLGRVEDNSFGIDSDDLRKFNGMLNAGIGADYGSFTLEFRYERGFDDFIESPDANGDLQRFMATIGWKIFD